MLRGKRVIAIVPARSGSKGVPDKNMRQVAGVSLIGRVGMTLSAVDFLDRRVISTDSPTYAEEGRRFGLDAPFLRPAELSGDGAGAVETLQHALAEVEAIDHVEYDIILITEPTSPFRLPEDVLATTEMLLDTGADSVLTVSPTPPKYHPLKALRVHDGRVGLYDEEGTHVVSRQTMEPLYWRNGICYALTRACLLEQEAVIGRDGAALLIDRPVVNIDEAWEFDWAEFLLATRRFELPDATGGAA